MSTSTVRFGIGFVVVVAAFGAVQTPMVANSLLLFVAAGVIPGTGLVLSPNAVFACVGAVTTGALLLLFQGNIRRAFARPIAVAPTEMPLPEAPAVEKAATIRRRPLPVAVEPLVARYAQKMMVQAAQIIRYLRKCGQRVAHFLWRVCKVGLAHGRRAWFFTTPAVDRWASALKVRIQKYPNATAVHDVWRESVRPFGRWLAAVRRAFASRPDVK